MKPHTKTAVALSLSLGAAGCTPVTLGAHAIQPSQAVDTPDVWIYLQTNDAERNGIYRCYDRNREPVCKKARLTRAATTPAEGS